VIKSFANKETEGSFLTGRSRQFGAIARVAVRKLTQIDLVQILEDLSVPPGNRLEALEGDRKGQHSIRINDQFRICFRWEPDGVYDVEIVDYH
jgi:proteic killer suppression protein